MEDSRQEPRPAGEADMQERRVRRLRTLGAILLAAWALAYVLVVATGPRRYQWDFQVYYYAAKVWAAGGDPYVLDNLTRAGLRGLTVPYVYLPATLPLFWPFALLPYNVAHTLWLGLTLLCVGLLVRLWRSLLPALDPLLFGYAILFGFGAAMSWALESGNVLMLCQVLLWLALLCLLRDRPYAFAGLMVLVGLFKLPQFALLGLLLFVPGNRRRNLGALAAGALLFGVIGLLPLALDAQMRAGLLGALGAWREIGIHTPCARAFIDHAWAMVLAPRGVPLYWRDLLFGGYCLALLVISWRPIRQAITGRDRGYLICVALILYSLLEPRFKIYNYLMLLVPTLALYLPVMRRLGPTALYAALIVLPGLLMHPQALYSLQHQYYPFLVNLLLWIGYVCLGPHRTATDLVAVPREGGPDAPSLTALSDSPAPTP